MNDRPALDSARKPQWTRPVLERRGTLRDIAGPDGVGLQAGPNRRSS